MHSFFLIFVLQVQVAFGQHYGEDPVVNQAIEAMTDRIKLQQNMVQNITGTAEGVFNAWKSLNSTLGYQGAVGNAFACHKDDPKLDQVIASFKKINTETQTFTNKFKDSIFVYYYKKHCQPKFFQYCKTILDASNDIVEYLDGKITQDELKSLLDNKEVEEAIYEIPRYMYMGDHPQSENHCGIVVDSRQDQKVDDWFVSKYVDGYMADSNYGMLMALQGLTIYSLKESITKEPACQYNDSQNYYTHFLKDSMNYIVENYEYDNFIDNQKADLSNFVERVINRQKATNYTRSVEYSCNLFQTYQPQHQLNCLQFQKGVKPGQVYSGYANDEEVVMIDRKNGPEDNDEIIYVVSYLTDFTSRVLSDEEKQIIQTCADSEGVSEEDIVAAAHDLQENFKTKPIQLGWAMHGFFDFYSSWPKEKWYVSQNQMTEKACMVWLGKNDFTNVVSTTYKNKRDFSLEDLVKFLN